MKSPLFFAKLNNCFIFPFLKIQSQMKKIFYLIVFAIFISNSVSSQISSKKITAPTEGNSVIYFLRTTSLGALMNIRYFDKNKYLGRFKGKNYIRYECEPGEKTFWIKAENIDVLKANLKEGEIYLVETNAVMGAFTAGAKFRLVNYTKKKQVKRIQKLLDRKEALQFSNEELKKELDKMENSYKRSMKKVLKKIKKGKVVSLTADNFYIRE